MLNLTKWKIRGNKAIKVKKNIKKISAYLLHYAKKIEAQEKKSFSYKKKHVSIGLRLR